MKYTLVSVLILVGFFLAVQTSAQIDITALPPCNTVEEWNSPGAVRVWAENGGILITWIAPVREPFEFEGYEIVRSTELNGPYIPIGRVLDTESRYLDESASPGAFYWYRVRLFREGLCSPFSEPERGGR